jgi:3-phenylpropionate/trans-cinnamate dioxygenase ferredoxin reductase subunit
MLVPLGVILIGPLTPRRGFWIEFAIALGFIGLTMMGMQSILTARLNSVSSAFGQDTLIQFHRQAGIVAFGLILAHPVILLTTTPQFRSFLDPRVNLPRALALSFVLIALVTLIVTSLWREYLAMTYEWWRLIHGALATIIFLIGIIHISQVRHYLADPWKQALWVAIAGLSIASILYLRVLTPLLQRRRPHTVVANEPEADRMWTLTVEPDGPWPINFRAGQFAFLTIAGSPFSLEQHPFSMSSSAEYPQTLDFTIKELGDYTSGIGAIEPGSRAYIDGPYGSLTLPTEDVSGIMFVGGGIGVTPIMSMLRTLRDRSGRPMPLVLIYAANRRQDLAFSTEIAEMASSDDMDLDVIQVLADPDDTWTGETGFVTPDLLRRNLPKKAVEDWYYVICGPPPMMEATETALLSMGVPLNRIDSERFDIESSGNIGPRQRSVRRAVFALAVLMIVAAALFAM